MMCSYNKCMGCFKTTGRFDTVWVDSSNLQQAYALLTLLGILQAALGAKSRYQDVSRHGQEVCRLVCCIAIHVFR